MAATSFSPDAMDWDFEEPLEPEPLQPLEPLEPLEPEPLEPLRPPKPLEPPGPAGAHDMYVASDETKFMETLFESAEYDLDEDSSSSSSSSSCASSSSFSTACISPLARQRRRRRVNIESAIGGMAYPACSARFPELQKLKQQLAPLITEENELDSDLECLLQAERNRTLGDTDLETHAVLFKRELQRLNEQSQEFGARYMDADAGYGVPELAYARSQVQWATLRLELKRRFLFVLLTGSHISEESEQSFMHDLDGLIASSLLGLDTGKPVSATNEGSFVASGIVKCRSNLPKSAKAVLKAWFDLHRDNPYPSDEDKLELARRTNLAVEQVSTWFTNERVRKWRKTAKRGATDPPGAALASPRKRRTK